MKKIGMILGILGGLIGLLFAIITIVQQGVLGTGLILLFVFSPLVIIASFLVGKWPQISAAVMILLALIALIWWNPFAVSSAWANAWGFTGLVILSIVGGILIFLGKGKKI